MPLFDQILSAIDNPDRQANTNQLGTILNTVQQVSGSRGLDSSTTQTVLSTVGSYVRSSLQQQRARGGASEAEAIVDQYSGTTANPNAVQALFSPSQQQQLAQGVSQRTGISADTIIAMLPVLVPVVLNLLKSGALNQGGQGSNPGVQRSSGMSNSVLSAFLDSDGDRDVDVGDVMSLASRFMNQRR